MRIKTDGQYFAIKTATHEATDEILGKDRNPKGSGKSQTTQKIMKKLNHTTTNRTDGILAALDYLQDKPQEKPVQMILKSFLLPRSLLLRLTHRPLGTLPPINLEKL
jgi:hypothetical protein